jgi:hypothetical protein
VGDLLDMPAESLVDFRLKPGIVVDKTKIPWALEKNSGLRVTRGEAGGIWGLRRRKDDVEQKGHYRDEARCPRGTF